MTREVSRENSQAAEDKDPKAVRPDQLKPDETPEFLAMVADGVARAKRAR